MKRTLTYIFFCAILAATPAFSQQGERHYVSDQMTINVRSGPSLQNRILAMVLVNQPVQVLETQQEWARVRLENGTEGWTQTRYLIKDKPAALMAEQYQQNYKQAKEQLNALTQELASAKDRLKAAESKLTATTTQLAGTEKSYTQLKADSEDVLKLKREHDEMKVENQRLVEEAGKLQAANDKLLFSQRIKWFLAGSGVFLLGWLIGYFVRRTGRKKSFVSR